MTHDVRAEALRLLYGLHSQPLCMVDAGAAQAFVERLAAHAASPVALGAAPAPARGRGESGDAIIPVVGEIVPAASPLAEAVLGVASLARIMDDVRAALRDPAVGRIVFDVASPGGTVHEVPDAADEILAARGAKPMLAVANGMMASAAFWLLAGVDRITTSRTGMVGSIAVKLEHTDVSEALARAGVKVTTFSTGTLKDVGSPLRPLTEADATLLQERVERMGAIFFEHVARARGLSVDAVRAMQGQIFIGSDALAPKLIDAVVPTRMALRVSTERLRAEAEPPAQEDGMKNNEQESADVIDLAEHRAAIEAAKADGGTAAVREERARATMIRERFAAAKRPDLMGLAAECIAEGVSVDEATGRLVDALAASTAPELTNRHAVDGADSAARAQVPNRLSIYESMRAADSAARGW